MLDMIIVGVPSYYSFDPNIETKASARASERYHCTTTLASTYSVIFDMSGVYIYILGRNSGLEYIWGNVHIRGAE